MKSLLLCFAGVLLTACASSSGPVPPPEVSTADYSQWTDQQLQMKIASYKRKLSSDVNDGTGGFGAAVGDKMFRDSIEEKMQPMEAELMRRDPSGKLLDQSGKM